MPFSLTSLQDLNVRETKINDEGLRAISISLTRLTKLDLESCESITGVGFACLSSLTLLQDLNVRETEINDEGLRVIDLLPVIHRLDLHGCHNVSDKLVASLSIPNVLVDEEDYDEEEEDEEEDNDEDEDEDDDDEDDDDDNEDYDEDIDDEDGDEY